MWTPPGFLTGLGQVRNCATQSVGTKSLSIGSGDD